MYVCVRVRVCVCVRKPFMRKRVKKEKRNSKKSKEREKDKNLFIQIKRQTDGWTDGRTDRHKSFIDMRYYTKQYSKSNSISRIKTNQLEIK